MVLASPVEPGGRYTVPPPDVLGPLVNPGGTGGGDCGGCVGGTGFFGGLCEEKGSGVVVFVTLDPHIAWPFPQCWRFYQDTQNSQAIGLRRLPVPPRIYLNKESTHNGRGSSLLQKFIDSLRDVIVKWGLGLAVTHVCLSVMFEAV